MLLLLFSLVVNIIAVVFVVVDVIDTHIFNVSTVLFVVVNVIAVVFIGRHCCCLDTKHPVFITA